MRTTRSLTVSPYLVVSHAHPPSIKQVTPKMGYTMFDQIWCKHWYKCHKTLESRDLLKTRSSLIMRTMWLTEDAFVIDVLDDEPGSSQEDGDEDVEVKEERDPGGQLVLQHRCDDREVDLGMPPQEQPCMPPGATMHAPWSNHACPPEQPHPPPGATTHPPGATMHAPPGVTMHPPPEQPCTFPLWTEWQTPVKT